MDPPAAPTHLLRSHSSAVTALSFSADNERLYSGDAAGRVVATSTRALRPLAAWPAHTDSILGVQEWGNRVVTHARDHKLHVWLRAEEPEHVGGASAMAGRLPTPELCYSMDVNALNFCRFSLLPCLDDDADTALLALPNLVESSEADVWALPARTRVHASVGTQRTQPMFELGGREGMKSGLIMGLHLFRAASSSASLSKGKGKEEGELRLLCAYEDGSVVLRRFAGDTGETSIEGRGWAVLWQSKLHVEAIMALRVSRDNRLALTVSADHLVGRYDLDFASGAADGDANTSGKSAGTLHRTTHAGNGCVALRDDARVCAVGGWDGRIRLYATKSMKPLGTLRYHKSGCLALEFARAAPEAADDNKGGDNEDEDDDDGEMSATERAARARWLAAGAKDQRVSIWGLISFERG